MKLGIEQKQNQQLVLTETMQQSLKILSMPSYELGRYITELAYSNPVIDMDSISGATGGSKSDILLTVRNAYPSFKSSGNNDIPHDSFESYIAQPAELTLENILQEQLNDSNIEQPIYNICKYIIMCLNDRGYLSIPLEEIASEINVDIKDATQALYAVQEFSPCGIGARNLEECLLLQLAQTKHFSADTVHVIKDCLPMLADNNISGVAAKLGVSRERARIACNAIRSLNPIPSSGFASNTPLFYIVPDAYIMVRDGEICIELNTNAYPRFRISKQYEDNCLYGAHKRYLETHMNSAKVVLKALDKRDSTMIQLLQAVIRQQKDYFLSDGALVPMTMKDLAQQMELSISTVSRAVSDKYIWCNHGVVSLKSLFSASVAAKNNDAVSADEIKRKIQHYIKTESKESPLSDEDIKTTLNIHGINVSRRTVAKYRTELGIPNSSARKA